MYAFMLMLGLIMSFLYYSSLPNPREFFFKNPLRIILLTKSTMTKPTCFDMKNKKL